MTSHSKRLQMSNNLTVSYKNHPPSIVSDGYASSISSQNSVPTYNPLMKTQLSIPENSVLSFQSSDKEPIFQQRPTAKFTSGPCSSIISSKLSQQNPSIGSRLSITSQGKIKRLSQSLGGSKASLATEKSHKSTVQQEFHDIKVNRRLNALSYGRASRPFTYCVICFVVGAVFFFIGFTIIMLRLYGQLFLSMDKGEIIGPIFIIAAIILVSVGIKFVVDAYRIGAAERRRLGFRACGRNMVTVREPSRDHDPASTRDFLQSGSSSNQAVRKVLHAETQGNSVMGSSIR